MTIAEKKKLSTQFDCQFVTLDEMAEHEKTRLHNAELYCELLCWSDSPYRLYLQINMQAQQNDQFTSQLMSMWRSIGRGWVIVPSFLFE